MTVRTRTNLPPTEPDPDCGTCGGEGGGDFVEDGHLYHWICDCLNAVGRKKSAERAMKYIPFSMRDAAFDRNPIASMPDEDTAPARSYAENVRENVDAGHGLWLTGNPGNGKSTCAAAIALRAKAAGLTWAFWTVDQLLVEIRDRSFDQEGSSETDCIEDFAALNLLILDDAGAEKASAWQEARFCSLLAKREEEGHPIVVTTNLYGMALRDHVGPGAYSRLHGLAGKPQFFNAPDYRMIRAGVNPQSARSRRSSTLGAWRRVPGNA